VPRVIPPQKRLVVPLAIALVLFAAAAAEAKSAKAPLPDLVVAKVSKPSATTAGSKLSLSIQVRNKGRGAAGGSSVGVYLAAGAKRTAKDRRLGRAKIKPLRAGKSAKATLKLTIPAGIAPGLKRLFVCADDARGVRESKEAGNCATSTGFQLTAAAAVPGPSAPAFSMTDGIDWGFVEGFGGVRPGARDPITVSMRAANGLPGQGGYTRSNLAPQPFLNGATTELDFSGRTNSGDDGAVSVILPFAFPFGGIEERTVSVGTNGWVSFGSPAPDRWNSDQTIDFRGTSTVLAEFERAIMPYWNDLDLKEEGEEDEEGTIREVIAPDGSAVAFQWDLEEFGEPNSRHHLQLVLFADGRFRFDYPGANHKGGLPAFVGYSLGTGAAGLDTVASNVSEAPGSSILFAPKPVTTPGPAPAGQTTVTLPPDTKFITADPGCAVTVAPTPFTAGSVSCPVPALAAGEGVTRTVIFALPRAAPGLALPSDVHLSGLYGSAGLTLTDNDEIDVLSGASLFPTSIEVVPQFILPGTPKVGIPALFKVKVKAKNGGLAQPSATFILPANTTLNSIEAKEGGALECGPVSAGRVTCKLADGLSQVPEEVEVGVIPTAGAANAKLTLEASAQALNAPLASGKAESPVVEP
jgi:hypothetical protein